MKFVIFKSSDIPKFQRDCTNPSCRITKEIAFHLDVLNQRKLENTFSIVSEIIQIKNLFGIAYKIKMSNTDKRL